jgi:hypothetical protein
MQHAEVELLLVREMTHTGDERLLERPIIGPFGKGSVDVGVMDFRLASGAFRNGQTFPLHPCIEHPQDEVEEAMIADFALRTPLGHREVREDKFGELRCGELDGNRRCGSVCCRCVQGAMASPEDD